MGNILEKLSTIKPAEIKTPKEDDKKDEAQIILFDCQLCNSPITPSMKFTNNNNNCPHIICKDCIANHLNSELEINAIEISCPCPDCETVLDPVSCRGIVDDKPYGRWLDRLCYAAIAGQKKSYCPYENCQALVIDECGGRPWSLVTRAAACPQCKRWFCFLCRTAWHNGRRCNVTGRDLISLNDMLFIEMTLGKKKKLTSCPKCLMYTELVPAVGFCIVKCRCKTVYCFHCRTERTRLSCECKEFVEEIDDYNAGTVCKLLCLTLAFGIGLCLWATQMSDNLSDTYF